MTLVDTCRRHLFTEAASNEVFRSVTVLTAVLTGGAVHDAAVELAGHRKLGDALPPPSGDLAVYEGVGSPQWVAHNGVKCSYDLAHSYFPDLTRAHYRD